MQVGHLREQKNKSRIIGVCYTCIRKGSAVTMVLKLELSQLRGQKNCLLEKMQDSWAQQNLALFEFWGTNIKEKRDEG